jgi:hypothetical protein
MNGSINMNAAKLFNSHFVIRAMVIAHENNELENNSKFS